VHYKITVTGHVDGRCDVLVKASSEGVDTLILSDRMTISEEKVLRHLSKMSSSGVEVLGLGRVLRHIPNGANVAVVCQEGVFSALKALPRMTPALGAIADRLNIDRCERGIALVVQAKGSRQQGASAMVKVRVTKARYRDWTDYRQSIADLAHMGGLV